MLLLLYKEERAKGLWKGHEAEGCAPTPGRARAQSQTVPVLLFLILSYGSAALCFPLCHSFTGCIKFKVLIFHKLFSLPSPEVVTITDLVLSLIHI